jgi:hypothetical protein
MAPDCHKPWPRDYLDASLPRAWINTKFRDHRRAVLLDRERSLLPATAPIAARVRAYERDAQAVHDALDRYRRLLDELDRCRGRVGDLTVDLLGRDLMFNGRRHDRARLQNEASNAATVVREMATNYLRLQDYVAFDDRPPGTLLSRSLPSAAPATAHFPPPLALGPATEDPTGPPGPPLPHHQTLFACPVAECRGYIEAGTRFTCGLCRTMVCGQCREVKHVPPAEDPATSPAHVCNPDTLASVRLLARDSKACPKCHAMIFRTDGCNQMFCTQCHVSFCWRTLEVLTGPVHNPHYFEWRRAGGGGAGGPVPDTHGRLCREEGAQRRGNLEKFVVQHARRVMASGPPNTLPHIMVLLHIEQFVNHTRESLANQHRLQPLEQRNMWLRVKFLLGKVDEGVWKAELQRDERAHSRRAEFAMIWHAFWMSAEEILDAAGTAVVAGLARARTEGRGCAPRAEVTGACLGGGAAHTTYVGLTAAEDAEIGACVAAHAERFLDLVDYTNAAQHRAARRFSCVYQRIYVNVMPAARRASITFPAPYSQHLGPGDIGRMFRLGSGSTPHTQAPVPVRNLVACMQTK